MQKNEWTEIANRLKLYNILKEPDQCRSKIASLKDDYIAAIESGTIKKLQFNRKTIWPNLIKVFGVDCSPKENQE
jgi:hypothetical protein